MNDDLLTREELSVKLNITPGKIDQLRREKKLPCVEGFKRPYKYNLTAVKKAIADLGKDHE